jgi:lysophospholipase L1-like esterase
LERFAKFVFTPTYGKVWQTEVEKFSALYSQPEAGSLVFLGDSHMEQCEWQELFPSIKVYNRGIGGESTLSLVARLPQTFGEATSIQIFLQCGVNDLFAEIPVDSIVANHARILEFAKSRKIILKPTLVFYLRFKPDLNHRVKILNQKLNELYLSHGIEAIDLNPRITEGGCLAKNFTNDGIHLNAAGYKIWAEAIRLQL